jgi:hypothetical protein
LIGFQCPVNRLGLQINQSWFFDFQISDEKPVDEAAARDVFWHDARHRLGKVRRLATFPTETNSIAYQLGPSWPEDQSSAEAEAWPACGFFPEPGQGPIRISGPRID